MTQPAIAVEPNGPLLALLEQHFSSDELRLLLGDDIPDLPPALWENALLGPLRDFLGRSGKEFRARFVTAAWQLARDCDSVMPAQLPILVELLHAGSLIIDDIQDGSAYRRGEPALHCRYGTPLALNAGNWLYFWPMRLLQRMGFSPEVELALHRLFSNTLLRCHQGQALDLSVHIGRLQQGRVPAAVAAATRLKTGGLMELAASLGATAADAEPKRLDAIARFGREFGTCLQMLDDLSGIVNERRCHKGHEDLMNGRPTWPWAWLADTPDEVTFNRLQHLQRDVQRGDVHPEALAEQLRDTVRDVGRVQIRRQLERAFDALEATVGPHPTLEELKTEMARLERSYV